MLPTGHILKEKYRIVSPLGEGGMSVVYRAWHLSLKVSVAVKEMVTPATLDGQALAQWRDQFRSEARIMARLNHPNLVDVIDYFEEAGKVYLVMRFIEGESLQALIERSGPLPEEQVLIWAGQILDALSYCHEQSIVHRDVKPGNIIIQPDGQPVLVDFGLVKLLDPNDPRTRTIAIGMGTPEYAPPEQYDSQPGHTGPWSDIYSLGATLYHALVGQAPLTASQRMVTPREFPPLRQLNPRISAQTEVTVLRAMAMEREGRFHSAASMAGAFVKPKRRYPPAVVIGAVLVLVVALSFGGYVLLSGDDPTPTATTTEMSNSTVSTPTQTALEATTLAVITLTATQTPLSMPTPTSSPPQTETPAASPTALPEMTTWQLGSSTGGRTLTGYEIGHGPQKLVFIGGLHGNEPATEALVWEMADYFTQNPDRVPPQASLAFLPALNPDALVIDSRYTPGGVDLNRNWDTPSWVRNSPEPAGIKSGSGGARPFSEPETAALRDWLLDLLANPETESVKVVVYHHHTGVDATGNVQPGYIEYGNPVAFARELALALADSAGYGYINAWVGSYTPTGELIQWCATQGIAAADVELPPDGWPQSRPSGQSQTIVEAAINSVEALLDRP